MIIARNRLIVGYMLMLSALMIAVADRIPQLFNGKLRHKTVSISPSDLPEAQVPAQLAQPTPDLTIPRTIMLEVRPGDTLATLLMRQGLSNSETHVIISAIKPLYKPHNLHPSHIFEITIAKNEQTDRYYSLISMRIQPTVDREIIVKKTESGRFVSQEKMITLQHQQRWAEGQIDVSLYQTAMRSGIPTKTINELIRAYSYDVDFQRGLQPGDKFGALYSIRIDPKTGRQLPGDLIYAELIVSGKTYTIYNFKPQNGIPSFYNGNGESVKKNLLRTPVDGARLSSLFGMRRHPIQGYTKKHKGVDFAAPHGTPIMAAGDGVVQKVGRFGSYGNYILIRHNREYGTAYAHLSRYARGLRAGQHVKQGQIIGFIGSTGMSSGPHLHYEVLYNGRQINPLSLKMLSLGKIAGADLKAFKNFVKEISRKKDTLRQEEQTMVAAKSPSNTLNAVKRT